MGKSLFMLYDYILVGSCVMVVNQHEVSKRDILEQFVVVVHPRGLALHASRRGQLLSRVRVDDRDPVGKDAPRFVAEREDPFEVC